MSGKLTNRWLQVHEAVKIEHSGPSVSLEWDANPVNDMLADSVLAVILQLESNPRTFKGTRGSVIMVFGT